MASGYLTPRYRNRRLNRGLLADMSPGRLACTLGALTGVALTLLQDALHLRPSMLVAVGLAALLTIIVGVAAMDARQQRRRRW